MNIEILPEWGTPVVNSVTVNDALANLEHVLALYVADEDDRCVLTGTTNVYGPNVWTGLTLGDLRMIADALRSAQ